MIKKFIALIFVIFLLGITSAEIPTFHQFYGNISDSVGNLLSGAGIDSYVNSIPAGSQRTSNGFYGTDRVFFVNNGKTRDEIKFYVGGFFSGSYIFENEGLTNLNLVQNPNSADILCGNGVIDSNEDCDGTNLSGQSCATKGFSSGSLKCTSGCKFDLFGCSNPSGARNDLGGGGSNGGGSNGILNTFCVSNWNCYWSICENKIKNYLCNDLNKCQNTTKIEKSEICSNENDTAEGNFTSSGIGGNQEKNKTFYVIFIFILVAVIIITIMLYIIIKRRNNAKASNT